MKMLNSYFAEIMDITDRNEIIVYGYTFRAKNMREANLHALEVSREMQAVPLPFVARINHGLHISLLEKYMLPTVMRMAMPEEALA